MVRSCFVSFLFFFFLEDGVSLSDIMEVPVPSFEEKIISSSLSSDSDASITESSCCSFIKKGRNCGILLRITLNGHEPAMGVLGRSRNEEETDDEVDDALIVLGTVGVGEEVNNDE